MTASAAAVLVAANLYSPLWKATVDGKPADIFPDLMKPSAASPVRRFMKSC
ncbi:MAG: hypothetical protein U1F65_03335 [Verrucomicrobiota bacterium]